MQKGNAPEERKIQRLFRRGDVTRLIKRCNDFGAGGVSVAIGELADGLSIDLDAVRKKYDGLDGTELAISESQERMAVVLQELYARGATIVSNEHGYGIYFRKEGTLYFVEMMADSDRAAEILMEAAREKEVIVEKAVITVGAVQPLFLGEGTRQEYGMIRFDAEPFDVSESYLRLMLEN
mgnify:CR=1 FL=1